MQILKKISIGAINNVRGGFKAMSLFGLRPDPENKEGPAISDRERVTVMRVAGIVSGYAEKTSETMGVSYAFKGEFKAINKDGEESVAPVCFLPEPAQSMIKTTLDDGATSIDIGFKVDALRNDDSVKGYDFVLMPLIEPRPSNALGALSARLLGDRDTANAPAQAEHIPTVVENGKAKPKHK